MNRLLPDLIYFPAMRLGYAIYSGDRRSSSRARRIDDRFYLVEDGKSSLYFCERTRLPRYLWRDGIAHCFDQMKTKYQSGSVRVEPGDVVVDVGANIGEFSLAVSGIAGRILAFEPDPLPFRCLEANGAAAGNITPMAFALSNKPGTVEFYQATATADSSIVQPDTDARIIKIEARTLDDVIESLGIEKVDFLKLEAEGWEPEVLEGAARTLKRTRKVAVDGGPERQGQSTYDAVSSMLKAAGFKTRVAEDIVYAWR